MNVNIWKQEYGTPKHKNINENVFIWMQEYRIAYRQEYRIWIWIFKFNLFHICHLNWFLANVKHGNNGDGGSSRSK